MKYYEKNIEIPIFFGELRMIITDDLKNAMIKNQDFAPELASEFDTYQGLCYHGERNGEKVYWIAVALDRLKASVISHECNHCALMIFHHIGQPGPDYENDEAFCYLHGWLVRQFFKFIEENKLKSKFQFS